MVNCIICGNELDCHFSPLDIIHYCSKCLIDHHGNKVSRIYLNLYGGIIKKFQIIGEINLKLYCMVSNYHNQAKIYDLTHCDNLFDSEIYESYLIHESNYFINYDNNAIINFENYIKENIIYKIFK